MSPEEEMVINRNVMKLQEHLYKALKQRDQLKVERDKLIDDIAELRTNINRLEQIRDIKDSALKGADIKIKSLERENKKLKIKNEYLLNVIKMSEHIQMHTDLEEN